MDAMFFVIAMVMAVFTVLFGVGSVLYDYEFTKNKKQKKVLEGIYVKPVKRWRKPRKSFNEFLFIG